MVDTILDDVKTLLKNGNGDPKVLKRIKRAAEQDEVISVYERDYVRKLIEHFLKPKVEEFSNENKIKIKNTTLEDKFTTKTTISPKFEKSSKNIFFILRSTPKTTKIVVGSGVIALALVFVVGISLFGMSGIFTVPTEDELQTISTSSPSLIVQIDATTYSLGDIISISGNAKIEGGDVELSILNNDNKMIWKENIKLKSDGTYSTLAIAGGAGWESSGEYVLKFTQGSEIEEITFSFEK